MSQTVVLEKPASAHLTASPGLGSTKPKIVAKPMPRTPTAAAGIGSTITPTKTAQKSAK
jgi:hypothetical protein